MSTPAHNLESDWRQPSEYEQWYASSLGRSYGSSLRRVLHDWLSELQDALVLDVGCGPGLDMQQFFPEEVDALGMDCSWQMARRALERCRDGGDHRRVVAGAIEAMPARDASFDGVFCVNCLEFVEDRGAAFRELARVLRPGGTAILGVLNRGGVWEWTRRLWRPFKDKPYYQGQFFRVGELQDWCTRVGLAVEDIRFAVPFPPVPPGPLAGLYDRWDRYIQEHRWHYGSVILCRARKSRQSTHLN